VGSLPLLALAGLLLLACGGSTPPPKTDDTASQSTRRTDDNGGGGPVVEQELGSIDPQAVDQTFNRLLDGKLESCHKKGRERLDVLAGEAKVFLRVGKDGRAKYTFFDESTIGDRDTEKCVLDVLSSTDWPKPNGGEAEVRSSFSWSAGGERPPTAWATDKVDSAMASMPEAKSAVDKCKAGVSGAFRITAYVEEGEPESSGTAAAEAAPHPAAAKKGVGAKKAPSHVGAKRVEHEHGGRFKAIGIAPPGKDGADKVDCIVDAIKSVSLPSPGSYVAKVTFTL
jgi:hypothetical protein